MQSDSRDAALLWDILTAAREIRQFVQGRTWQQFEQDKMLRYAVERQILVIGEASRKLSQDFRNQYPEIPWNAIISQRNIIAHEYGEILTDRIWNVAVNRIPELIQKLGPLLPDEGK
jgi:uncharacterized protein with HEPN domain